MAQSQSAKISQSLRNENDLKPTPHDLENIFDTDEEIEAGDSVISIDIVIIIVLIICVFFQIPGFDTFCDK